MNRLIILGLLAAPALGCNHFKAVGPFSGKDTPRRSSSQPNAIVTSPKEIEAMPVFADAPPPPAPTRSVTPGDVTNASAGDAAKKLMQELEADRKAGEAMPHHAEISRIPRNGR